jgi:hypothetical protein
MDGYSNNYVADDRKRAVVVEEKLQKVLDAYEKYKNN